MSKPNELLYVEKQLLKDQIISAASALVKDHDSEVVGGMTEVSYRLLSEIDNLLFKLNNIEHQIADNDIAKM